MMMATAVPPSSSSFLPLLESLEDGTSGPSEQTDAYLTIANRLSGEEGRHFLPAVEKHFSRLGNAILAHITSTNAELSQAALQALGFCVYHSHLVSAVPEAFVAETLTALCSLVVKSTDKNTCTRALWVISKQSFTPDVVAEKVPSILGALESVWSREDIQSVVMEHEALNVVIRLLEQVPAQMSQEVVRWAKLIIPLVVHSASKVRLRAAAAMEMGMPLLLKKQTEVAAVIEPLMSSKLIPELQKLFMSKNETNVLKLWPLFVRLLGKLLHRGGPFINSLLHLEELGFRSSSPTVKKIAFIAWKSLIDNFALNPDILCSAKRMKLLMQPLTSINVRTEALMLTKVEVWWYLVVQLGPNLSSNFDQVSVPLLQSTLGSDCSVVSGTPLKAASHNGTAAAGTSKTGTPGFNSQANTSRMSLNSSVQVQPSFPCIQLLGLEMLLHYFLGPEAVAVATKNKLVLSLEPLKDPLLSGASSFTKHATVLTSSIRDGFTNVGKDAPDSLLAVTWTSLARFVNLTIESGTKKDRQGCEVLTLMLQALQSIVTSEALPAARVLTLFEATVQCIPQRVLGSASYQVGKMDVLNGTPARFLILLLYNSSLLPAYTQDERFFQCLQKLVVCGLSGPTSSLAFAEAVLGAIKTSAGSLQNKEQLWRMWSVMVGSLTDTITQSNEVNQGDALEHNFSAVHSALLFPVTHLLHGAPLQQAAQKSMLSTWSKLYKVFARCSALVATAEENVCCEEFCAKMAASIDKEALKVPSTLNAVSSILQVMMECVDFSPYTPQFQQKLKSPHTPVNWMKKRNKALGNLFTLQSLLVQCLEVYLEAPDASREAAGAALASILSTLFTNLILANSVQEALTSLIRPLSLLYEQASAEPPKFSPQLLAKLEKLLSEILNCLQNRSTLAYNDELLALLSSLLCVLFPHKSKLLRSSVTHFWNATFANSVSLTYPDELRPILSQVKQKTPIILPGFEVVTVSDELSEQYSSESSQMETKLSGMPVSSVGKRDSLLTKAAEPNDRTTKTPKPVSTKLDFGSPKPPCRGVLEEEASIDFVFIPPETKQRVLTEHQKEVKRTKRVDIPAMYNNLDASLDTTVFSQFTQSQEDSANKVPTEQADKVNKDATGKDSEEDMENEDPDVLRKETQDYASPQIAEKMMVDPHQEEMVPESTDVSMEEDTKRGLVTTSQERISPNMSASPDLVSTPQKPNSRRQPFITLEKYGDGKPASPSTASTFKGPLVKTSNSQEHSGSSTTPSSQDLQTCAHPNSQGSQSSPKEEMNSQRPVNDATESPRRPKDSEMKSEPVRLIERLHSDTTEDEDVIPDTQTKMESKETKKASGEMKTSSQEEETDSALDDSQSSVIQSSQSEPRRSGRHRVRPLLPGENPDDWEEMYKNYKQRRSGSAHNDSPIADGPYTRSKQAAEEDSGKKRLRSRTQRDQGESSRTPSEGKALKKIRLLKSVESSLDKPQPRRRSPRESSQTDMSDSQSDHESQSQGSRSRPSKTPEEVRLKKKVLPEKEESSQTITPEAEIEQVENDNVQKINTPSPPAIKKSQEVELVEQNETNNELKDCQMPTLSPENAGKSQEVKPVEQTDKDGLQAKSESPSLQRSELLETESRDALLVTSPNKQESQDRTSTTCELDHQNLVKDKLKTKVMEESLSHEDSQETTPSSDSQSLRRSRRSKASSEAEPGDGKLSLEKESPSNSQTPVTASDQTETRGGRTRRSKVQEQVTKLSPSSNTDSSQSQDAARPESLGRGRYSRRRSLGNVDTSESDSSEPRESGPVPKRRGKKPRASLQSPLSLEWKGKNNADTAKDEADHSQKEEASNAEEGSSQESPETLAVGDISQEQCNKGSAMNVETDAEALAAVAPEKTETHDAEEQSRKELDNVSSVESGDTGGLRESAALSGETIQDRLPCDTAVASETSEEPQISETSEEKVEDSEMEAEGNQKDDSEQQEPAVNTVEDESLNVLHELLPATDQCVEKPSTPVEKDKDDAPETLEEEETKADAVSSSVITDQTPVSAESAQTASFQESPMKQDLDAVMAADVGESPLSSRTRGTWSPSASPSTSILKKGQKRPLEEESPSPLVKSRRVSFANPIQHQETADDIDRRSPAIRTSSPRRSRVSGLPQPKYVTTPTKGLMILSPRNLHSPGYRSSKKCLISEMSQEPRAVSRDCIYPALVGCSAPVEAVLPQISSNMWSRGFGHLVRARNIKTIGDLSALTPSEVKTLPIRSPKLSNVKKALKSYEQQRKGRTSDELKSFDETEMLTSEPEEISAPENQDEEEKVPAETLATELLDEPAPADVQHQAPEGELVSEVEALTSRMTPVELSRLSPQQLVQMHEHLGGMMRCVVMELQTRLCQTDNSA
ncbi:telomere-associated protein RIF1 isoform X2 [Betta splendens]|uniref:Telomere-associated protein RIF1 isoform X2 n=1 Tax=Betta splendens TaxID=158456 RepID=A0A6P7LG95_BETSP|nr:telomere-associated protein RIF1 isoform X2 [Betta splendens]